MVTGKLEVVRQMVPQLNPITVNPVKTIETLNKHSQNIHQ